MKKLVVAVGLILTIAGITLRAEPQKTETLPRDVKAAKVTLVGWLNEFRGNNAEQVAEQLGLPSEKTTWDYRGRKETLLRYQMTEPHSRLELYFLGDEVITGSLQVLTD